MTKLILERDVENYLKKRIKELGGRCLKFPATYEDGIPDRLIILPGGRFIFAELKRPQGGRLSEVQAYQISKLRALGCKVYVLKNFEEIDKMLEEEL